MSTLTDSVTGERRIKMSECSKLKYCRGVCVFCNGKCNDCDFTAASNVSTVGTSFVKNGDKVELTDECIVKIAEKVVEMVAKVNDITRCKDCKYSNRRSDGKYWCCDQGTFVEEDGFCSWAERIKNNGF